MFRDDLIASASGSAAGEEVFGDIAQIIHHGSIQSTGLYKEAEIAN